MNNERSLWLAYHFFLNSITKTDIVKPCEAVPKCRIKHYNTSREYILQQVNRSLEMLSVKSIDLLLLHRQDMLMDADEVSS
jgi:predicted oxidoreductase